MSIYFRSIKYKTNYNIGFEVDGDSLAQIKEMQVGDTFIFSHPITVLQYESMQSVPVSGDFYASKTENEYRVYLPFTIAERSAIWSIGGKYSFSVTSYGYSVTLEAKTGWIEDMFKWVFLNEVPTWSD